MPAFTLAECDLAGDTLELTATGDALVLFGHAEPTGEPMVSHCPFVMNTADEIGQAIRDYQGGKFS